MSAPNPGAGIEVEVFSYEDPTVSVGVLPRRTEAKVLGEVKGTGGGSVGLQFDDPVLTESPTILDYQNVVKMSQDGRVVEAFIIQDRKQVTVGSGERSSENLVISGEGLRGWFRAAVVYPAAALRSDSPTTRPFSFAVERDTWYKPAAWRAPVRIQQHNLDPNSGPFNTAPAYWPDVPSAWWIWGTTNNAANPAAEGWNYFRYEFTVPDGASLKHSVFAAGANRMFAYLDGEQIMDAADGSWTQTLRTDLTIRPGNHVLAFKVFARGDSPAGLIAAFFRDATLLTATGASGWLVNSYPTNNPGWSPGGVLLKLLAEAQDRGVFFPRWLKPSFTSEVDSNNVAWSTTLDWSFSLGTSYLDVISQMEEIGCDLWIDPDTFTLNLAADRGLDLSIQNDVVEPVSLTVGRNLNKAEQQGKSEITNHLLIQTEEGWAIRNDSNTTSRTRYGRFESLLATGLNSEVSRVVANAVFTQKALPWTASTYTLEAVPGATPFEDFGVGDWVLAPNASGAMERVRVLSISTSEETTTGTPVYAAEFGTIAQEQSARFDRWVRALAKGSMSGFVSNAGTLTPTTPGTGTPVEPPDEVNFPMPAVPQGLAVTSDTFLDSTGQTVGVLRATWSPVSLDINGKDMPISGYDVAVRTDETGSPWSIVARTSDPSLEHTPITSGLSYRVRVRAVGTYSPVPGVWSGDVVVFIVRDSDPPPLPSDPRVTSRLGSVVVEWDGKSASGGAMPLDFARLDVRINGIIRGSLTGSAGSDVLVVADLPYDSTALVSFRSMDRTGNLSDWTPNTSVTVVAIKGPDIEANSITTNKILAGSITSDLIQAGAITATKLAAGSITAEKMSLGVLQSNRLRNPGFEDTGQDLPTVGVRDKVPGWEVRTDIVGPTGNFVYASPTTPAFSGAGRATLTHAGGEVQQYSGAYLVSDMFPVRGGETLQVGAVLRCGATRRLRSLFRMRWYDSAGNQISNDVNTNTQATVSNTWFERSASFVPPTGATQATYSVQIQGAFNAAGDWITTATTMYVDDCYVIATGTPSAEITAGGIRMWNAAGVETVHIDGEGARIKVGSVEAGAIAAGAITTSKIALGVLGSSIVANGSFEDTGIYPPPVPFAGMRPKMRGWTFDPQGGVASESGFRFGDTNSKSGNGYAFLRIGPSASTGGVLYSDWIPVEAGSTYRIGLSAWSRINPQTFNIQMDQSRDGVTVDGATTLGGNYVPPTSGYTNYAWDYTPPTNITYARFRVVNRGDGIFAQNTLSIAIDDVFMISRLGPSMEISPSSIRMFDGVRETISIDGVGATIRAGAISGTTLSGNTITGGTITGNAISGGTISGTTITGTTISGNTISGGTISGTTISGNAISGGTISGTTISGTTINGGTITGVTINSGIRYGFNNGAYLESYGDALSIWTNGYLRVEQNVSCAGITASNFISGAGVYIEENNVNMAMNTTTAAANVAKLGTQIRYSTSLRKYKKNRSPIDVEYGILDLEPKTWTDAQQLEDDPDTKVRHAGFVAEDVRDLSSSRGGMFDSLLTTVDGELQGLAYDRIPAFLIPVIRDMSRRITELETSREEA